MYTDLIDFQDTVAVIGTQRKCFLGVFWRAKKGPALPPVAGKDRNHSPKPWPVAACLAAAHPDPFGWRGSYGSILSNSRASLQACQVTGPPVGAGGCARAFSGPTVFAT